MKNQKSAKRFKSKRFWYSVMPLLLMVGVIALINLLPTSSAETPVEGDESTAVSAQVSQPLLTGTLPPILQATVLPSPTPTITPRPNVPDEATIVLLGPPAASFLPFDNQIVFYWSYSEALAPGQEFTLTVHQDTAVLTTATLTNPNFGNSYRVTLNLGEEVAAGEVEWQVALQWPDQPESLLTSETRSFTLLPES